MLLKLPTLFYINVEYKDFHVEPRTSAPRGHHV